MAPPPRAVRLLVRAVVAAVLGSVWLLAAAMLVTGLVLWRDWHALAREGVAHEAAVESCTWKPDAHKRLLRTSGGFYSCDYRYRLEESGPDHRGYFQSAREWKSGEPIAIRYRPDQPAVSATRQDLKNPSVVPAALVTLPLLFAAWQLRARLRRLVRRSTA